MRKIGALILTTFSVMAIWAAFDAAPANAVIKNFCTKSIGSANCSDPFTVMTVADTSDDTNGGCPTGQSYQGCVDNFKNQQVCCGPDTGGKMPCGVDCKVACAPGQSVSSNGWCPSGKVCCKGEATAECANESVVQCYVGSNKPSDSGLTSYLCVPVGTCKGTDLGPANCKQGLSGTTCCNMPKCAGAKQTTDTKTTSVAPPKKYYALYNAIGTTSIPEVMGRVIKTFLGIVGAIALAVFVYGGVTWMTARGNAKQADSARGAIVNAVIGLVIIAFAYTLSSNFITMLTTVQVPPPEKLPAEQQTTAETEQAAEQQSVQQQKAAEQQAKEAGSQSAPAVSCAPGRTCVDLTCEDKTIYSQCWAAGCTGIQVCCPTTLTCPSPK